MTSRLDRLFVLLEAGAGAATRRAAARQLGEVQRAHPHELHRLLGRLMTYLKSPVWETRVAASQAVEAILANVPEWNPTPCQDVKKEESPECDSSTPLRCETFDMDRVLEYGAHLMSSEGTEFDHEEETGTDLKERLSKQRKQLNSQLGLDMASKLGIDISGMYTNEDLLPSTPKTPVQKEPTRRPVQELVPLINTKPLSTREINLAKRKARQAFCKQKSRECSEEGPSTPPVEPDAKKIKLDRADSFVVDSTAPTPDYDGTWGESPRWPLEWWCLSVQSQLFSGSWEARHGAASALRELLKANVCNGAGKNNTMDTQQMEDAHQAWLEDMALRLLCVLALDRFGDFVSDQVVAPVRETCAQALGVALAQLREDRVRKVAELLSALTKCPQWEARHGALLGFKYLVAARQELACESGAVSHLVVGLDDAAEDVSAVAAGALTPLASTLIAAPSAHLTHVVARLWDLLHDQDDLAAPAQSYMSLLAALVSMDEAAKYIQPIDLPAVVPIVFPYLSHPSSSVRLSSLQTLSALTAPHAPTPAPAAPLPAPPPLVQHTLRHVYQRVLFEHLPHVQDLAPKVWYNVVSLVPLESLLVAACPMLSTWLCLAMQPARVPLDAANVLHPPVKERRSRVCPLASESIPPEVRVHQKWLLGGGESTPSHLRDRNVTRARTIAAKLLGYLSCYLVQPAPGIEYKSEEENPINCYVNVITVYLKSGSALQRLVVSLVISSWAQFTLKLNMFPKQTLVQASSNGVSENGSGDGFVSDICKLAPPVLINTLHTALNQLLYYDEVALNCNRILQEARDLLAMMKHYKLPVDCDELNNIIRLEQVMHMTTITESMISSLKSKRPAGSLEERRKNLQTAVNQCYNEQNTLNVSVQAAIAGACVNLHCLPEKLNPVIRPLMESIKKEPFEELQIESANNLAILLDQLVNRETSPNAKVLLNLKSFLRCDPELTPRVSLSGVSEETEDVSGDSGNEENSHTNTPPLDKYSGILSLWEQQRAADKVTPKRGRPPAAATAAAAADVINELTSHEDEAHKSVRIQRRGATLALTSLTKYFGPSLPDKVPKLWEFITEPLNHVMDDNELDTQEVEPAEELISKLQVFETVAPHIDNALWPQIQTSISAMVALTRHRFTAVRHMAARCLAVMACRDTEATMQVFIDELLPMLGDMRSSRVRCGASEAIGRLVDALQLKLVPYIVLLVVPLLGRMSDPSWAVRSWSSRVFASLIQLMPLDSPSAPPAPALRDRTLHDRAFLQNLFNPTTIPDYKLPIPVNAELRTYQQAGVNWLRFLYSYKIHGVLCDDMGLGKTLQSIVAVAGAHEERARLYAQTRAPDLAPLSSLVVCPPTLTGHWVFEVNKFISSKYLRPMQYVGPPVERERLRTQMHRYNLIVASYDIVRKDIEFFSKIQWNYCILDEGHVIKNGKTKAFKAIKQLVANHRLILSGTPIQNNVVELWSLFEFLMPGLLGSERQFSARYSRPILGARDPRATQHQLQAGALACEALHRQVLPFLLRRVKEDVLKELPPKITQDYYCELSPLQRRLYEDFSKTHMPNGLNSHKTHVFQALHYLQNVCNHPKLVLTGEHPEAARVAATYHCLDDIDHAAKLPALKQLLLDCGIGTSSSEPEIGVTETVVSQHRALIFCQLKKMLDIVEKDLLKRHLPNVSYLRLDGSVPAAARHSIVTRFNNDPSIDLLLLTTAVGGLGLNLTGADTVIFVEHDWNPMKDLQAMDRAHRIGQRRVVNVYRLITRDTLEEKIMGLQKFKLVTANTVISSENAAMETMGTDQLLELFPGVKEGQAGTSTNTSIEALSELWDDRQYEEEYDMTSFIKSLNNINT